MFAILHSRLNLQNFELTKLNCLVCELGTVLLIQQFFILKFDICLRVRKFTGPSEKRVPEKALKRFTVYCTK